MQYERINELLKEKGWSRNELFRRLNLDPKNWQKWAKGETSPEKHIPRIAELLDTTEGYLRGLTDNPSKPDPASEWLRKNAAPAPKDFYDIPIIGDVSAGLGVIAEEHIEGYEKVPVSDVRGDPDDYFYLRVRGNSMSPTLEQGDIVLIKKQNSVDSGQLAVVIIDDEEGVIKRVKHSGSLARPGSSRSYWIKLISDNEDYKDRAFYGPEVLRVTVVGVAVQSVRKFL